MLSTSEIKVEEKSGVSKYLTYGVQLAMVVSGDVRKDSNGKTYILLHMESPEVKVKGFEPDATSKRGGKVGTVKFMSVHIDESNPEDKYLPEFLNKVGILATKLGVLDKVNAINEQTIEQYIEKLIPIIRGKFAWFGITGQEYKVAGNDRVRTSLGLRRYGFVASEEEGENHLRAFDKNNKYDFQSLASPSRDPEVDPISEAFGDVGDVKLDDKDIWG